MRPRHMRTPALAMAAAFLGVAGCASDSVDQDSAGTAPSAVPTYASVQWERLPAPLLTPRLGAIAVALDEKFLVVGGDDGPPCPPNADCAPSTSEPRRDGATYDPATRLWENVAQAPVGLLNQYPHVVAGEALYILTEDDLLCYDSDADTWSEHPVPDSDHRDVQLVSIADRPAAVSGERSADGQGDEIYDPETETWADLPADPLGPSFDRTYTDTSAGAVLTAKESVPNPGSAEPTLVRAALLSEDLTTWKRLPDSDLIGGYRWAWTGERMVDPTLGEADGGQVGNWGRSVPFGGRFDPATETWGRLPAAPEGYSRTGWKVEALGGPVSAAGGWFYDDRSGRWSKLLRPDGAPEYAGPAAWVGDTLFVLGGQSEGSGTASLSGWAWALRVAPA